MEEEIKLCYLDHEVRNNQDIMCDYLMSLMKVEMQYAQKSSEKIKYLKKAKVAAYLIAGAYDACNFMAAVAILNASSHEYPVIDAFLVPMAFTGSLFAMSNRARDAVEMVEETNRAELEALRNEYDFYGDRYLEVLSDMCDHEIDLDNERRVLANKLGVELDGVHRVLLRTPEMDKRISQ